jgi:hypothetical protein
MSIEKDYRPVPLSRPAAAAVTSVETVADRQFGPYRLRRLDCRTVVATDADQLRATSAQALIWVTNDDERPVSAAPIVALLHDADIQFVESYEWHQAKLDVFSRLKLILIPINGKNGRSNIRDFEFERLQKHGHFFELFVEQ